MGSRGTGSLSDYSDNNNLKGGAKKGGDSGEDPCDKAFTALLEDVERCDYYKNHKSVPPRGTVINVSLSGRLSVETSKGEIIGYLPTAQNYLAGCMKNGRSYGGQI